MKDKDRGKTNPEPAQEAQKDTGAPAPAFYDAIPEEQAQQLIAAAAIISGKPAAELTLADALQLLKERGIDPANKSPFADNAAAILWENMSLGQLEQLQTAEDTGETEPALLSIIGEIAQKAQERTAEQEAQEDTEPHKIVIDMSGYDPKLDPNSPEFDLEAWKAAIAAAGGYEAIRERLNAKIEEAIKPATEALRGSIHETMQTIVETAKTALSGITAFINSDAYKAIKENMQAIAAFMEEHRAEFAALAEAGEEIQSLAPFLQIELEEAQENPEFADCSLVDILRQGIDENGNPTESKFRTLIERAKQRRAEYEAAEGTIAEIEQASEELPRIISNPTEKLNYPLDKPNSIIWNLIAGADPNGQIQLAIDTGRKGSKQDAAVLYGINFDELETSLKISKTLTPFDKRCYIAAAALFNGGNDIVSATQIYKMMGNRGQPKAADIQKINDSLTKMGAARVLIDNTREVQTNKKYSRFRYDASLLPFERISAYINNTLTESAIHFFREPPLITFARERKQITSLPRQLLESPVSKTDANLRIDDYLIERIAHMKSGKGKAPRKILYATLFDRCDIKTVKQKQRAPEKIRRYLDYYKQCDFIKGYREDKDGITILL